MARPHEDLLKRLDKLIIKHAPDDHWEWAGKICVTNPNPAIPHLRKIGTVYRRVNRPLNHSPKQVSYLGEMATIYQALVHYFRNDELQLYRPCLDERRVALKHLHDVKWGIAHPASIPIYNGNVAQRSMFEGVTIHACRHRFTTQCCNPFHAHWTDRRAPRELPTAPASPPPSAAPQEVADMMTEWVDSQPTTPNPGLLRALYGHWPCFEAALVLADLSPAWRASL